MRIPWMRSLFCPWEVTDGSMALQQSSINVQLVRLSVSLHCRLPWWLESHGLNLLLQGPVLVLWITEDVGSSVFQAPTEVAHASVLMILTRRNVTGLDYFYNHSACKLTSAYEELLLYSYIPWCMYESSWFRYYWIAAFFGRISMIKKIM